MAGLQTRTANRFDWSEPRLKAAELIAEGRLTDTHIAELCGFSRTTFYDLRQNQVFRAKVDELIAALERRIRRGVLSCVGPLLGTRPRRAALPKAGLADPR
jgi:hypothetical protein